MTSKLRSFLFLVSIYLAFFASGAASLIAEVTWNRMLIVVVGNSLSAAAMIISVFMGGLGLGSWVGGRWFGRRNRSLLPYLALEITIGIFVLLSPALFDALAGLFTRLAESVDDRSGLTLVRIIVSLAGLFLPAFLMGATFPAIVSGTAHASPARRTARTGYLYSANTLGAAIGCFAAGYHLLLEFGVATTLKVSFTLYLVAAASAFLAHSVRARRSTADAAAKGRTGDSPAKTPSRAPAPAPGRGFLAIATFVVGFVALAYEVLLTRLSILYLGNSVSVFPLVLTSFLLGTGFSAIAGTWAYSALRARRGAADRLFGIVALAAGVFVLAAPYLLLTDWIIGPEQFARFADSAPRNPLPILGILVLPTVLLGALLPLAIRMLHPDGRDQTRGAATLYALNTAGGVIGAAVANHLLVPVVGVQRTLLLLVAACMAIGMGNLFAPGRSGRRWAVALGAAVVVTALAGLAPPDMMALYAGKIAQSTRAESAEVRLVHEGRAATVTVLDQRDARLGDYRDMYLNGVEEASTRFWHTQLFKLLGLYPVLAHESDDPKDVLVVAFGAGITAGSVLASEEVTSLEVVDLNPDIEGINDLFTDVNGDVFHRDRFTFHNDDGRNYLVTSRKQYDVIISDSTHPRAYDSWILYTEEFYRAVKRRLKPGGVWAQWVPVLGSMQGDLFKIHLNTFRTVFPHTTFWFVYGSDQAFLLATPEPYAMDVERLQGQLDRLPDWFRADEYQIDTAARIGGFFWMDEAGMERMIAGETRLNTDDLHYFDKQSAVRPAPPQFRLPAYQSSLEPHLTNAGAELAAAVRAEQVMAGHVARFVFFRNRAELHRAFCLQPENGNIRYLMAGAHGGRIPEAETFCREEEIRGYRALLEQHPDNFLAMNGLADALAQGGRLDEALPLAERAVELSPENGMILDTKGWILFRLGRVEEALETLRRSDRHLPNHPIVLHHLGRAYHAAGDPERARDHLRRALARQDDFPGAAEARELLSDLGG